MDNKCVFCCIERPTKRIFTPPAIASLDGAMLLWLDFCNPCGNNPRYAKPVAEHGEWLTLNQFYETQKRY